MIGSCDCKDMIQDFRNSSISSDDTTQDVTGGGPVQCCCK
jgi:hypothetical protein